MTPVFHFGPHPLPSVEVADILYPIVIFNINSV